MKEDHQSISDSSLDYDVPVSTEPLSPRPLKESGDLGILPQETSNAVLKGDREARLKFAEEIHQYVREYIRLADQKATFFFAGSTALLAYLHNRGITNRWVIQPLNWGFIDMLSFVATICLVLAAMACIVTVVPRLRGSRRGLIFFAAICEYDNSQAYVSDIMRHNIADLCEAKLRHAYDLSDVCKSKYDTLRWGQWLGSAGVVATLLLLIVLK